MAGQDMTGEALDSALLGQESLLEALRRTLSRGRALHAYLLAGADTTAGLALARVLAADLTCPKGGGVACGHCGECKLLAAGNHPDVIVLGDEGPLRLGPVREAARSLSLRAVRAQRRVLILDGAERLTPEAAASLLKVLEEPPGAAVFFLVATDAAAVPATIRSRCACLALRPVPAPRIELVLRERGADDAEARFLSIWCGGRLSRAVTALTWDVKRATALPWEVLRRLCDRSPSFLELAEEWERRPPAEGFEPMDLLLLACRDLLLSATGGDRRYQAFPFELVGAERLWLRVSAATALEAVEVLVQAVSWLEKGANRRLVYEW
ncbi:MAG: hypothetical protein IRY95_10005, partial [Clostridia bacterium]|nr:hypothetical protein [Clostridia bacterium]